jgi:hypothetical protein
LRWHVLLPPGFDDGKVSLLDSNEVGRVRGLTPKPTPTDGWRVSGQVVPTRRGLTIRELTIKPSPTVWENGKSRPRTEDEHELDIDSSVLRLIDLTKIRDTYRREVDAMVEHAASDHRAQERWEQIAGMASKQRRRRSVNNPDNMYLFSQDVLEEARSGRGIRRRLSERWNVSTETVKSRMSLLRKEKWIEGGSTRAQRGPVFRLHEQKMTTNNTEEET